MGNLVKEKVETMEQLFQEDADYAVDDKDENMKKEKDIKGLNQEFLDVDDCVDDEDEIMKKWEEADYSIDNEDVISSSNAPEHKRFEDDYTIDNEDENTKK